MQNKNKHPKKILHIFHNFEVGGSQNRLLQYFEQCQNTEICHVILALGGDYTMFERIPDRVSVQKCEFSYKKNDIWGNVKRFRALFASKDYDIIHTHNWASFEAVIANTPHYIPHIHNEDGFGTDEATTLKFRRNLMRRFFLIGKTLIVPSQTLYKIAKTHWVTPWTKSHYIPNGVMVCSKTENIDQKPFDFGDKVIIGTVATLRPEKSLKTLIKAVSDCIIDGYQIALVIVGDGTERLILEQYAQDLGLTHNNILFTGYQKDYRHYMAYFDIFALSSMTEQQPYGILDASALGKAIIATDVGDIKNMVPDISKDYITQDAFVTPYSLLKNVIINKDLRDRLGNANKDYQYSFHNIVTSMRIRENIITSLIV